MFTNSVPNAPTAWNSAIKNILFFPKPSTLANVYFIKHTLYKLSGMIWAWRTRAQTRRATFTLRSPMIAGYSMYSKNIYRINEHYIRKTIQQSMKFVSNSESPTTFFFLSPVYWSMSYKSLSVISELVASYL